MSPRAGQFSFPSRPLALAAVPTPSGVILLAAAGEDGVVWLWDPTTGQPVGDPLTGHTGPVHALAAVPAAEGGSLLAPPAPTEPYGCGTRSPADL